MALVNCAEDFMSINGRKYDNAVSYDLHPHKISLAVLDRETFATVLNHFGIDLPKDTECLELPNGIYVELDVYEDEYEEFNHIEAALFYENGLVYLVIVDDYCTDECQLFCLQS